MRISFDSTLSTRRFIRSVKDSPNLPWLVNRVYASAFMDIECLLDVLDIENVYKSENTKEMLQENCRFLTII
jgi:hypothetical protein